MNIQSLEAKLYRGASTDALYCHDTPEDLNILWIVSYPQKFIIQGYVKAVYLQWISKYKSNGNIADVKRCNILGFGKDIDLNTGKIVKHDELFNHAVEVMYWYAVVDSNVVECESFARSNGFPSAYAETTKSVRLRPV